MNSRRAITALLALTVIVPIIGCNAQNDSKRGFMKKEIALNVVVYNYLDRPIFEVLLNGQLDGGAAALDGGRAISVGVPIPLGQQTLTWRLGGPRGMPRNGETIVARNSLVIAADQISPDTRYMAIHIYPDETAEFTFAQHIPEPTARGAEIFKEAEKNGR